MTEERDLLILVAASVVAAALVIQVIHRGLRRRRHLGAFADVKGEDMEEQ